MGFDGLDVNMGCPVRKIIKTGGCGALVTKPDPEEWIGFLLEQDLGALTIRGRIVSLQSDGEADRDAVSLAVRFRSLPSPGG